MKMGISNCYLGAYDDKHPAISVVGDECTFFIDRNFIDRNPSATIGVRNGIPVLDGGHAKEEE